MIWFKIVKIVVSCWVHHSNELKNLTSGTICQTIIKFILHLTIIYCVSFQWVIYTKVDKNISFIKAYYSETGLVTAARLFKVLMKAWFAKTMF